MFLFGGAYGIAVLKVTVCSQQFVSHGTFVLPHPGERVTQLVLHMEVQMGKNLCHTISGQ